MLPDLIYIVQKSLTRITTAEVWAEIGSKRLGSLANADDIVLKKEIVRSWSECYRLPKNMGGNGN